MLTVKTLRELIAGLPDDTQTLGCVMDGPDEWTIELEGFEILSVDDRPHIVVNVSIVPMEGDDDEVCYRNFYRCDDCYEEWDEYWDCQCDDECPKCGVAYTPVRSEEVLTSGEDD